MKKFLVVLLILAVAGGAFAQLTLTGNVTGGVQTLLDFDKETYYLNGRPNDGAFRMQLNGAYTNADKTSGANFQLRFNQGGLSAMGNDVLGPTIESAYGWFKPMDIITIYAGRNGVGGFGTPASVDVSNGVIGDARLGLSIKLEPMDGLVVGFTVNPGILGNEAIWRALYKFGMTYTMPDLVKIVANGSVNNGRINVAAGFDILALKDMGITKLAVDAALEGLNYFDNNGLFQLGQTVTYASGDISATLRSTQLLPLGANSATDKGMVIRIHATGSYTMGDIVPSLGVGFVMNGGTSITDHRSWNGLASAYAKDTNGLIINPQVQFKIGGGTIDFGYSAMVQMHDTNDHFKNSIYVNFNRAF